MRGEVRACGLEGGQVQGEGWAGGSDLVCAMWKTFWLVCVREDDTWVWVFGLSRISKGGDGVEALELVGWYGLDGIHYGRYGLCG